jgi:hypothetical protein
MLSVLCFVVLFSSCKKERFNNNNTGKELLSEEDLLNLSLIDSSTINTKSILSDSLRTDEVSTTVLLGSYVDPVFGKTSAEIFTQVRLSGPVNFTPKSGNLGDIQIDSFYLQLPLVKHYGNLTSQTFEVYKMTESIDIAEEYYSNESKSINATNYVATGFENITPNTTANVVIDGETKVPMLRIRLDNALAQEIINETGNSTLAGNDGSTGFVNWFKGLKIKVNNASQAVDEGAILTINIQSAEAKLVLDYLDTSEDPDKQKQRFQFNLGSQVAYFNRFEHDYTSTAIQTQLSDPSLGNNQYYLQTMAGLLTEIDFPYLKNLSSIKNIVVNKAELILPVEYDAASVYTPTGSLFVLAYSNENEKIFLPDQFIGNIGGQFNTSTKNYIFNITAFVNRVISGELENSTLLLNPVGGSVTASRVVGLGKNSTTQKPILKLYYSTY